MHLVLGLTALFSLFYNDVMGKYINDGDVGGDASVRLGLVVSVVTSAKPRYYILKQC